MNRNTLIAFVLLIGIVMVFTSPWYNEHVLGIKPTAKQNREVPQQTPTTVSPTTQRSAATLQARTPTIDSVKTIGTSSYMLPESTMTTTKKLDTIWIKTDKVIYGISEDGGRIVSLKMREYKYHPGSGKRDSAALRDSLIEILQYSNKLGAANLTVGSTSYDGKPFTHIGNNKQLSISGNDSKEVVLAYSEDGVDTLYKKFTFVGNSFRFLYVVQWARLAGQPVRVGWDSGIRESEIGSSQNMQQYAKITAHYFDGRDVAHIEYTDQNKWEETRPSSGNYWWLGLTSKYFLVAFMPDTVRSADLGLSVHKESVLNNNKKTDFYNYGFSMTRSAESDQERYWVYVGPSQQGELASYKVSLEKVLFNGWKWFLWANIWFPVICEYLLIVLLWINGLVKDYGVAILLITILVKLVTYPLSVSSMRSMSRMKMLQPKITAIREKHKSNPTKMNQAIMAMYKEEGVNPLNPGCLPMFLQMPLLFALYVVLMKSIEMRGAATILIPWVKDLSQPEVLFRLPFTIPWYGDNFAVIPVIMAVVTFVQNKMTMKDPNQQAMVYMMPIFMFFIFNGFPAGLVMYWTFSSVLGIVQQYAIEKTMPAVATPVVVPTMSKGTKNAKK